MIKNYKISLGDKARLKSGGPEMLVVDFEWGKCICAFPIDGGIREYEWKSVCLEKNNSQLMY